MEKFSKWRDPGTGIQPFLPQSPPSSSPLVVLLFPFGAAFGLVRLVLLSILAAVYYIFYTLLTPLGGTGRLLLTPITAILARTALLFLGYYSISTETVQQRKGPSKVSQTARGVGTGDVVIANWSGYVDVLYFAFRYNPTFLLPLFETTTPTSSSFGRASGTGSAAVLLPRSSGVCVGYVPVPLLSMLGRTGSLPPTISKGETFTGTMYKTIADARRKTQGPIVLFPEGTTSNGRAVLKFGEGVISEEIGKEGAVWIKFVRHATPSALLPPATCPIPSPFTHLLSFACTLPLPRSMNVRTLHPSASPSSPSFLPSEILASQPGGLAAARNERTAWRDACAVILAETGRTRRVAGMGWEEKGGFLEFYFKSKRR